MNIKKYINAIFALVVVIFLIANKSLTENFNNIYRNSSLKTDIKLQSVNLGLELENPLNFPHPIDDIGYYNEVLIYNAVPRSFTVTDLNQDGFVDICTVQASYENSVRCFYNLDGTKYVEATAELGLDKKTDWMPSAVYSADFNNDGMADLLIVKYGKHQIFLRDSKRGFIAVENLWFSNAWGANFADFNNDGLIDIIFANYYSRVDLNKNRVPWNFKGIADQANGDTNEIWINRGNGRFEIDKSMFQGKFKEHTTSIGIADYNRDGKIKIFESNDYSIDRMFSYNAQNKVFEETTNQTIPPIYHGFSGMNTEFYDFNKDGYLDLLVSNITIPPLLGSSNILWIWNNQSLQFNQKAKDMGVDRCGYAWTAKSVDFNIDGENEIISASGFYSTETGKINLLFYRLTAANAPKWFPQSHMPKNINDFSISTKSRPCLFYKTQSAYADVSESVIDWNNYRASRTLVAVDINNDGKMDLIIPEHGGITKTYLNQTETKNNWVGLDFVNAHGSHINFGVKAELVDAESKLVEYFELNPTNGFKSQHDFRKIIGLGKKNLVSLKLYLNDGETKNINLKVNQYNEIKIY